MRMANENRKNILEIYIADKKLKEEIELQTIFYPIRPLAIRKAYSEKLYLLDYIDFDRLITTISYEYLLRVVELSEGALVAHKLDNIRWAVQDEMAFKSYLKWKRQKDRIKRFFYKLFKQYLSKVKALCL